MAFRRQTTTRDRLDADFMRHARELAEQGYNAMLVARSMPTGEIDMIIVPYREKETPERLKQIGDELERLCAEGFQLIGMGDLNAIKQLGVAAIDPTALSFDQGTTKARPRRP